ncbi:MAG: glutaminyl-peptide cyclotransferase [Pyrinomonadaceae bacterium]
MKGHLKMRLGFLILFVGLSLSCKTEQTANRANLNAANNQSANVNKPVNLNNQTSGKVPVYTYEIVNTYKHDPKAFTEGLFYQDGFLYESTGQPGASSLRKVELETGKVVQKFDLPKEDFGEGIAMFGDKIYQLTWQQGICRVFDAASFKLLKELNYAGEGWGMTRDDKNLIMSDGTHVIRYVDPETFQTVRTIATFDEDGKPLMDINELELIKGEIWANVWHSENIGKPNTIARIDPQTGKLLGWIDLQGISPDDVDRDPENTMNGIAYDAARDRIFVTGKDWKKLFEIKVKPKQ